MGAADWNPLWAAGPTGAFLFAVLVAGLVQFAQLQRSLDRQALLSSEAFAQHDRLLQIVNEETGVRGYIASNDQIYLSIYYSSQQQWLKDAAVIARTQSVIPKLAPQIRESMFAAQDVQQHFRREIALMRAGRVAQARGNLSHGKRLFDRLRAVDTAVQQSADAELAAQRAHTSFLARAGFIAAVLLCGVVVLWTIAFALVVHRSKLYRLSALRDPLTGVQNRRGLIAAIDRQVASDPVSFGLVFVDLDGFKKINDVYGHATGDATLRAFGARLQSELRANDTVARLGGDEFVTLVASPAAREEVRAIAERLRKCVCRPYEIDCDSYVVGCSVGVSMYPEHGRTAESLMARADSAMYAAKAGGGGVREATAVADW